MPYSPAETGGQMEFASLKYDDVFRELMSHENIRKQLISDVTGIPLGKMKSAKLVTPYLRKRYRWQKQGILDIAVALDDGTKVDIELQVRAQKFWMKRKLFYLARMYAENLRVGQDYDSLPKCISISILDFTLIKGTDYHTVYTFRDKKGRQFTDLFELHIIELTKELKGEELLDDWIRLFNAKGLEDLSMIKTKNSGIIEAVELVKRMSLGKKFRLAYEEYVRARRDRWAEDEYVKDLGREEGRAEIICNMLQNGITDEEIMALAECDRETLEVLKKKIKQ